MDLVSGTGWHATAEVEGTGGDGDVGIESVATIRDVEATELPAKTGISVHRCSRYRPSTA